MGYRGVPGLTLRHQRLKLTWLMAIPFLVFARPLQDLLLLGGGLAVVGLLLRGWAAGTIHKDQSLATSGPYALLRHPLYVGSLLVGAGLAVAGGRWFFLPLFLALFALVYGRTIRWEEGEMDERFGAAHEEYRRTVPRFVPRIRPYAPASGPPPQPPGFRFARFQQNKEWQAGLGVAVGFGLLCLKAGIFG